jgi:DNA-binding transcriptional MerR regulator/quercetin dioxygenase-like cupin family protein
MGPRKTSARKTSSLTQNTIQFRISEVAKMLNISASALRQWEAAGLTQPSRTHGGYRTYSLEQVNLLKYIQDLRMEKGLNIEAIRHLLGKEKTSVSVKTTQTTKTKPEPYAVGRKLRHLRKDRGITLAQTAEGTGLSPSFLSCLERGQVYASMSTLQKLSIFYKSSLLSLFETSASNASKVSKLIRPNQRKKITNEPGIDIELLAAVNGVMEVLIFHLAPGTSSDGSYYHEGEEFIFMLSGVCEFWLDEVEHYLLREGDCLYFSSMQNHRWSNPGQREAVLFWVNTPPTF